MRIGHARPSSALLGAAEPVATRSVFRSVEGSLRGTSCRRDNRAIPSQAGLFSGQDGPRFKSWQAHPPPLPVETMIVVSGAGWVGRVAGQDLLPGYQPWSWAGDLECQVTPSAA